MELKSSAFSHGEEIPRIYTCQGEGINPPLEITGVPKEALSLVLIMDDPDVPEWVRKEKMYDHWILFNIDPKCKKIEEGAKPFATPGKNTAGKYNYVGPCPPDGRHRYFFKLYALDTMLDLSIGIEKKDLEAAMQGHILVEATLMGTYSKS